MPINYTDSGSTAPAWHSSKLIVPRPPSKSCRIPHFPTSDWLAFLPTQAPCTIFTIKSARTHLWRINGIITPATGRQAKSTSPTSEQESRFRCCCFIFRCLAMLNRKSVGSFSLRLRIQLHTPIPTQESPIMSFYFIPPHLTKSYRPKLHAPCLMLNTLW